MEKIQASASLFEVNMPEFKSLKQSRRELRMLKVNYFRFLEHTTRTKPLTNKNSTVSYNFSQHVATLGLRTLGK